MTVKRAGLAQDKLGSLVLNCALTVGVVAVFMVVALDLLLIVGEGI
jgi:hypothetical protein